MLACVLLAAWFIPDQNELIRRMDQDGMADRLQEITAKKMAEREKLLVEGNDRQKLHVWLELTDLELRDDPAILADRRNLCANTPVPMELGEELFAHARNIDPLVLDSFADSLVKRALGLEHPGEAGELVDSWVKLRPSWDLASRAVQAWRWADHPEKALASLEAAVKIIADPASMPPELDEMRITLALESNQGKIAFALVRQKFENAVPAKQLALLRRLVEMAPQTDCMEEASALVSTQLKHVAFHTLPLKEVIDHCHKGDAFATAAEKADYEFLASSMARWLEWADRGSDAFDTWLRLALLGNQEAWDRAIDLQEDLLRTDDFALVLKDCVAQGKHLDKEPMLADILLDQGQTSEALGHYAAAAQRLPDPSPVYLQIARIHQQSGEWQKAIDAFSEVLKRNTDDIEAQKGCAFALVRLQRYEDAFHAYLTFSRVATDDPEAQETCAAISDSLGHPQEAAEATQRLLACTGRKSTPEEYLDLADQLRFLGNDQEQVATLRHAMAEFSHSNRIRITLAEALSTQGNHEEAVTLLADASVRNDPAAIDLLISEAMESSNAIVAVESFKTSPPPCLAEMPDLQLRLAFLFEHLGFGTEGNEIVNRLESNDAYRQTFVWHDLAKVCVDYDDTSRAEAFELLHLSALGSHDSKSWELLGDIYTAEDRATEADAAYKKAVEMLGTVTLRAEPAPPKISQANVP